MLRCPPGHYQGTAGLINSQPPGLVCGGVRAAQDVIGSGWVRCGCAAWMYFMAVRGERPKRRMRWRQGGVVQAMCPS